MTKEEKISVVNSLTEQLNNYSSIYVTDVSNLTVAQTNKLRRMCFEKEVKFKVVKNILLKKALESFKNEYEQLLPLLKGSTSIMFTNNNAAPAKIIKEFRKENDKPLLKGAYLDKDVYLGDNQLEILSNLKSKKELLADIIALLQSPAKNVISSLLSGKNKIAGVLKTLSERNEDSSEKKLS